MRNALLCVALGAMPAWPRSVAAAAPNTKDSSPNDLAELNELIARGIALRKAGEDARALEVFQRAETLAPDSTRVRVHLAAAHQALGQWEEADHYLTLALQDANDPYVQKHQSILASARRTIDTHMASLHIIGGPRGAQVRLNGRALGALPLQGPVRVQAGIYMLEAELPGHYPVTRSVALAGGSLVREQITLTPMDRDDLMSASGNGARDTSEARWLPWTFAGLAAGSGIGAAIAWAIREKHVERWNDDELCLSSTMPTATRGEICADQRDSGDKAETWMWIGAASAGAFAAASAVTFWVMREDEPEQEPDMAMSCGIGLGQVRCAGTF